MAPKKTPMSDAAIKALIAQGVADSLVDYEANRDSGNRHDSHDSGSGGRRHVPTVSCSVMASKPKTMQEAIEFANDPMDKKIHTFAERQTENKRKLDNNLRYNQAQQHPFKRKNVARAYTTGPGEKEYGGTLPLCTK
ncbi:hypothetical protein Tco_1421940 [Tanacetum coccineum]